MDDVRYSELLFLRSLANRSLECVSGSDPAQAAGILLDCQMYAEMVVALLEDLYIQFDDPQSQLLVFHLRREVTERVKRPLIPDHAWDNPRYALQRMLTTGNAQKLRLTYRGLRRIDELRDTLRYDRTLEDFGVLLSIRYFNADLDHALERSGDIAVSVLYVDMDEFGPINKEFGQKAGHVVMKAYLETIRDRVGLLGTAFRGVGDEVAVLVLGQGHDRAVEMAEQIQLAVAALRCRHLDQGLPRVTTSIGVATTPPEQRRRDLVAVAEARKRTAKGQGKDRVIAG